MAGELGGLRKINYGAGSMKRLSSRKMPRAFTLLELFLVIAIIALAIP
jgi:prepilin-type N-terminal cleavage/methylation domain-containing protein